MSVLTMDWPDRMGKLHRGDLLAFPRSTYIVLGVKTVKRRDPNAVPRLRVWGDRPENMQQSLVAILSASAELRGATQTTHYCYWNPRKKKRQNFEQLMRFRS